MKKVSIGNTRLKIETTYINFLIVITSTVHVYKGDVADNIISIKRPYTNYECFCAMVQIFHEVLDKMF